MKPTLHQNSCATQRDRLINLLTDFFYGPDVSVRRTGTSVKSTERADHVAHIRVVDIAIDDVRDDVVRVPALSHDICCDAQASDVRRFKQSYALVCVQAFASKNAVKNWLNVRGHV